MKVENMTSARGNSVPNQFITSDTIRKDGCLVDRQFFQSYKSTIALIETWPGASIAGTEKVFLDERYWDYSRTTGKYRNQFLGECISETRKKINSGTYKLVNLN